MQTFSNEMSLYEIEMQARRMRGAFMGALFSAGVARLRALFARNSGAQHA